MDYIVKPFHPDEIIARVNTHLELASNRQLLHQSIKELTHKFDYKEERLLNEIEQFQ
ncbi:hypothetical protein ACMAZF_09425 [Psychrobium sp. nBUS_13]|uniref:hypothetical protein n=1 Tax=Psychrobium sp. nBUS_13 TaxID=3395319 RepID=UPI003EB9C9D0